MPVRRLLPKPVRPSIRKSGGWVTCRFPKQLRRTVSDPTRFPHDAKVIFKHLLDTVAGANGGKMLSSKASSGRYYWHERSRGSNQSYYTVRLRGNHIVVTRTRLLVNGKGINSFAFSLGVGPETDEITNETAVILRHPYRDYQGFVARYRELAADLDWW